MAEFKFRMETIRELYSSERDQRRLELADAYHAEEILRQQQSQLEEKVQLIYSGIRADLEGGAVDPDRLLNARRFVKVLQGQIRQIDDNCERVQQEIQRRLENLIEADRQVKVMEKLKEQHLTRFLKEEDRKELRELDEIGQQQFHRRAVNKY